MFSELDFVIVVINMILG